MVSSNILSSQGHLVVNPWRYHSQPRSPGGETMEAPLEGSLPTHHHGQLRHHVTPTVKRVDNASRSFRESSSNDCAHLAEITADITLSELQRLGPYTKAFLQDVAHQAHEMESIVEYVCATTNVQRYSAGKKRKMFMFMLYAKT